jgi:hypothetical protein
VSIDHKPFRDCERDRVLKTGGKIEKSLVDDRQIKIPFKSMSTLSNMIELNLNSIII